MAGKPLLIIGTHNESANVDRQFIEDGLSLKNILNSCSHLMPIAARDGLVFVQPTSLLVKDGTCPGLPKLDEGTY
jgi:hypothetical protein